MEVFQTESLDILNAQSGTRKATAQIHAMICNSSRGVRRGTIVFD